MSKGESTYDGLILGLRRRMSRGFDLTASYTLGKADSVIGTANDELDANYIQDATDPLNAVNNGPSNRTDARHRVSISAVIQAPWGIQVAPFFLYRSALPMFTFEGTDINNDSNTNDITAQAYKFTGLNDDGTATFEETGRCETVNCSRRAPFSQLNLRISKSFRLVWHVADRSDRGGVQPVQREEPGAAADVAADRRRQRCAAGQLHAACGVCRRLPAARAARRADRLPVLVLK